MAFCEINGGDIGMRRNLANIQRGTDSAAQGVYTK